MGEKSILSILAKENIEKHVRRINTPSSSLLIARESLVLSEGIMEVGMEYLPTDGRPSAPQRM